MRSTLGFAPLIPSPDPASMIFNAAMVGASILGPLIKGMLGTGHLEANQIVVLQNELNDDVLAPATQARVNPRTSIEDLMWWRDTVLAEGEAFYHFTEQFPEAGPGARRTIFGHQDATGNWIRTTAAPGYASEVVESLERVILERTGDVRNTLGFDWGKLAQVGVQIAAGITGRPVTVQGGGQIVTGLPPSQRNDYYPSVGFDSMPSWVIPAGIGVVVLLLLTRNSK